MSIAKKLSGVARGVDVAWDLDFAYYSGGSEGDGSIASSADTGKSFNPSNGSVYRGVCFKSDGSKMYVLEDNTNNAIYQYSLSTPFDVSTASYDSKSLSINAQATAGRDIDFSPDGTTLVVADATTSDIFQYTLSTAWDISTGSYASKTIETSSQATSGQVAAVSYNSDGTKIYIVDNVNMYAYDLSTPYDISTASYNSETVDLSVSGVVSSIQGIAFKADGTRLYASNNFSFDVADYYLSTPWDITTATWSGAVTNSGLTNISGMAYVDNFIYFIGTNTDLVYQYSINNRGIEGLDGAAYTGKSFNPTESASNGTVILGSNGTKLYYLDYDGTIIVNQYTLTTPYDVSTASYDSKTLDVSGQVTNVAFMRFKPDGTTLYIADSGSDRIYQYTLSTAWDVSTGSYASKLYDSTEVGTSQEGFDLSADGTKLYIAASTEIIYQYTLSTAWDISTASYDSISSSVASQVSTIRAIQFSSDGSKLFCADQTTDEIYMYRLTTPYDISTAIYTGVSMDTLAVFDGVNDLYIENGFMYLSGYTTDTIYQYVLGGVGATNVIGGAGIAWNDDGTKMYWVDTSTGDEITEFNLSTPYDISTAVDANSSYTVTQDANPSGITFKPDGTQMYVSGNTNDTVYQYSLSTAWDVSTATYASKSVVAPETDSQAAGIRFNNDGTKLYIVGVGNDKVYELDCSTAYDVSTATYSSVFISVSLNPIDIEFDDTGSKLFVTHYTTNRGIYEYNLTTPYDLSTATLTGKVFRMEYNNFGPTYIAFKPDGTGFITDNASTPQTILQFTIGIQE